jgi:hypothetical protein
MKEAAATALVALVCLGAIYVVASMRGGERQLSLHLDGVVLLALAVLLVAAAMHIGVHLLVCLRAASLCFASAPLTLKLIGTKPTPTGRGVHRACAVSAAGRHGRRRCAHCSAALCTEERAGDG